MTLSPTSNVTVPPVRKLGMAGRNRPGNPLSIAHPRHKFNAKVLKTGLFSQFCVSGWVRSAVGISVPTGLDGFGISTGGPGASREQPQRKCLNPIQFLSSPGVDPSRYGTLNPGRNPE